MSTMLIDTHRLVQKLREQGFSEAQAAGITEAIQEIDLSDIATKADILQLERRMDALQHALREVELRITVKLGGLIAAGVGLLAAMNYFAP